MIASTINTSTIIVDGNQSGKILFSIVYDEQSRVVKIDPVRDLKAGEKVRVILTSEILTVDQGHIPPYMYSFKIKPTGGSGIFPETVTSYLGEDPISAMLTGDFDRDGDLDLCVIRTENSLKKLYVIKNGGTGRFSDTTSKTILNQDFNGMLIGDYDNDGDLDVAITKTDFLYISIINIFKNNGLGEFSFHSSLNNIQGTYLEQADIDNDNDIDFVMLTRYSINQYKNNGDGVFSYYTYFGIGCQYYFFNFGYLAVDDFDGDNDQDIYYMGQFREEEPGYVCFENRMYLNNGSGDFNRYNISNPVNPSYMVTNDLNNDRKIDIIMPPYRLLKYNRNLYTSFFQEAAYPGSATTGDFDGDGDLDVILAGSSDTQPTVNFNDGQGNFTSNSVFNPEYEGGGYPAGDFDNDGDLDILKGGTSPGEIKVYKNFTYCSIFGPSLINIDSVNIIYNCSGSEGYWILTNNPPCNASISGNNYNDTILVNSGNSLGTFDLSFYLPDSTLFCSKTVSIDDPLPVDLISFYSTINEREVILNWTTASELNNYGFDIERLFLNSEENQWDKIGFVRGLGTASYSNEYIFHDKNLLSGNYKYRLKQIDINGAFKYHDLESDITLGIPVKFALYQNYPNPFNPVTIIDYDIAAGSFVSLKIFDNSGREVSSLINEFKPAGYYSVSFNASGLASGVYYYRLSADKFIVTKKLAVIK